MQLPRAKCMVGCTLYLITLRSVGTVSNPERIKNVSKIIMGDRLILIFALIRELKKKNQTRVDLVMVVHFV